MKLKSAFYIVVACSMLSGCYINLETPAGNEGYVFESPRMIGKGWFRGVMKGSSNYGMSFCKNEVVNVDFQSINKAEDVIEDYEWQKIINTTGDNGIPLTKTN